VCANVCVNVRVRVCVRKTVNVQRVRACAVCATASVSLFDTIISMPFFFYAIDYYAIFDIFTLIDSMLFFIFR